MNETKQNEKKKQNKNNPRDANTFQMEYVNHHGEQYDWIEKWSYPINLIHIGLNQKKIIY